MSERTHFILLLVIVANAAQFAVAQSSLGTAFTYQGRLSDTGGPADGLHDFRVRLFDADAGGTQVGATQCANDVNVTDGLFTVTLDFGAQFDGLPRFLQIEVRASLGTECADPTGFVPLAPRQAVTAAPQALFALNTAMAATAGTATNSTQLNGQPAAFYQDASNLSSGTLPAARLPGTVLNLPCTAATPVDAGMVLSMTNSSIEDNSDCLEATAIGFNSTALTGRSTGAESTAIRGVAEGGDSTAVLGVANSSAGSSIGVGGGALGPGGIGVSGHNGATTGTGQGVRGVSASRDGRGVVGIATNTATDFGVNYGVYGESAGLYGSGVFGRATFPQGDNYGGRFEVDSPQGFAVYAIAHGTAAGTSHGVFAQSNSISGTGVFGYAIQSSGDTRGVYGQSNSSSGRGVYGLAASASGQAYGVYGESNSESGQGVRGVASNSTGSNYGVFGQSHSSAGIGVHGRASSLTGTTFGGHFESASEGGSGVSGRATATDGFTYGGYFQSDSSIGTGVYGFASAYGASDYPYGVRGVCSAGTQGYAVYASGDMGASGFKSFRIDHPSDPTNKYLLHYSAESPEVINFYRGAVTLDEHGEARVEMPQYFATINKDPSYQLTAVGAPMPMLHVAEEISAQALKIGEQAGPGAAPPICSFRVAGGAPGGRVSWRVEALRNDLRMRLHGAPVEREKAGPERGRYQHPEYYGQPPEKGMHYDAARLHPSSPIAVPPTGTTKE